MVTIMEKKIDGPTLEKLVKQLYDSKDIRVQAATMLGEFTGIEKMELIIEGFSSDDFYDVSNERVDFIHNRAGYRPGDIVHTTYKSLHIRFGAANTRSDFRTFTRWYYLRQFDPATKAIGMMANHGQNVVVGFLVQQPSHTLRYAVFFALLVQ